MNFLKGKQEKILNWFRQPFLRYDTRRTIHRKVGNDTLTKRKTFVLLHRTPAGEQRAQPRARWACLQLTPRGGPRPGLSSAGHSGARRTHANTAETPQTPHQKGRGDEDVQSSRQGAGTRVGQKRWLRRGHPASHAAQQLWPPR